MIDFITAVYDLMILKCQSSLHLCVCIKSRSETYKCCSLIDITLISIISMPELLASTRNRLIWVATACKTPLLLTNQLFKKLLITSGYQVFIFLRSLRLKKIRFSIWIYIFQVMSSLEYYSNNIKHFQNIKPFQFFSEEVHMFL